MAAASDRGSQAPRVASLYAHQNEPDRAVAWFNREVVIAERQLRVEYHTGAGKQFSLGFEGANIVQQVFGATHGDFDASVAELTRQLTIHARIGEEVGNTVAASSGWTFAGVDPTPAPLADASIGDAANTYSIRHCIEADLD